ncbi:MAG: amino acid ABC transporter permease [Clostridiales bacterium]|jgi:His/Glu/Gln/Arg/opine family amino acid ABC transporter permease subunit|nr:amino acid ABC transporter permease [Clostridiales bacterium]
MVFHFEKVFEYRNMLLNGIMMTLAITAASLVGAFVLSVPLALIKLSKNKALRAFGYVYTDIFRGLPALVQLNIVYFAMPLLLNVSISAELASFITLSLNSAAYMSEAIRGGLQAIDVGQTEAAKALGVPYFRRMKDIIFPQAMRSVLPALVNETVGLLKETSLVSTVGVVDLMRAGKQIVANAFLAFEPLITVGIIYYVMVKILSVVAKALEKRFGVSART